MRRRSGPRAAPRRTPATAPALLSSGCGPSLLSQASKRSSLARAKRYLDSAQPWRWAHACTFSLHIAAASTTAQPRTTCSASDSLSAAGLFHGAVTTQQSRGCFSTAPVRLLGCSNRGTCPLLGRATLRRERGLGGERRRAWRDRQGTGVRPSHSAAREGQGGAAAPLAPFFRERLRRHSRPALLGHGERMPACEKRQGAAAVGGAQERSLSGRPSRIPSPALSLPRLSLRLSIHPSSPPPAISAIMPRFSPLLAAAVALSLGSVAHAAALLSELRVCGRCSMPPWRALPAALHARHAQVRAPPPAC